MPSFSLRVKKNWYQNRTESEMGLLTEYFREKLLRKDQFILFIQ